MTERPILFSGPMVRAILSGQKTQTRRVVKGLALEWLGYGETGFAAGFSPEYVANPGNSFSPYGFAGDRLWVRENTRAVPFVEGSTAIAAEYCADGERVVDPVGFDLVWWGSRKSCPSIHMPRFASRIHLAVTEVRIERLQSISEHDAQAEGVSMVGDVGCPCEGEEDDPGPHLPACAWSHLDLEPDERPWGASFAVLWDSINAAREGCAWDLNPWVWVVTFKRLEVSHV